MRAELLGAGFVRVRHMRRARTTHPLALSEQRDKPNNINNTTKGHHRIGTTDGPLFACGSSLVDYIPPAPAQSHQEYRTDR